MNTPAKIGRALLMNTEQEKFLVSLLEHSPDLYLDELVEELEVQHGIHVSIFAVWRTLQRLGLRRKKLSRIAAECSEAARTAFQWAVGVESTECLVYTNESAIYLHATYRLKGWS
ncbi:hypothetical protein M422DRAFT_263111 [Sphaerobolus stellatus SS14]|uniref:Winged helix-turn helix domain-containing protein n=1 Tax=Sphaerobolus stellatus (strain SS14) TaxID=990650 RepID=A0A0C9VBN9_SPHS4|nr:hypothetical protein M422DRAFT_263111 [Sphaerobolus stellatus SS14]